MRGIISTAALAALLTAGVLPGQAVAEPRSPDQTRNVSVAPSPAPDMLDDSRPMLPARDVAKVKRQQAAVPATTDAKSAAALGEFHTDGYTPSSYARDVVRDCDRIIAAFRGESS